jgi:hypothetical protein
MAGRFWSGVLDSITLTDTDGEDAGFTLTGANRFDMGGVTGARYPNADGSPAFLYVEMPEGKPLELAFLHIPATLLRDILDAIIARTEAGEDFLVSLSDGFQSIETYARADAPGWYERGEPDGAYIKDAVIRLISTGGL